jgi:hypothetical protein
MLEVEVRMTAREFEQTIRVGKASIAVRVHVSERTADEDVSISDVRSRDGESNYRVSPSCHSTFLNTAEVRRKIFDACDPVVLRRLAVHDEVGQTYGVDCVLGHRWSADISRRICGWATGVDACCGGNDEEGECQIAHWTSTTEKVTDARPHKFGKLAFQAEFENVDSAETPVNIGGWADLP